MKRKALLGGIPNVNDELHKSSSFEENRQRAFTANVNMNMNTGMGVGINNGAGTGSINMNSMDVGAVVGGMEANGASSPLRFLSAAH